MPAIKQNTETPAPRSVDPGLYGPAPAGVAVLSATLDLPIVARFREILRNPDGTVRENGTLTNGRVYPGIDDEQYKSDLRYMRKHLSPSVNDGERIKVVNFGEPGAVGFYLTIAKRNPRKAKGETAPETPQETPAAE